MASRAASDLLLVGSLPADSTDDALRTAAEHCGDLLFALPDGETGPRAAWVGYEREQLIRPNPAAEITWDPGHQPRHIYDTPIFRVRRDTELRFERWPRIDDAIESYQRFRALKADGVLPGHLRFQVGLPFPGSAMNAFRADFPVDYPVAAAAYEDLVVRELGRLTDAIPPAELAIQWDCGYEAVDIEGVLAWTEDAADSEAQAWDRFAGPVTRLSREIPAETLIGYHLCYGTFPEWPIYEAGDMGLIVRMANFAVAESGRPVDWLHLAGPRYLRSTDRRFFAPLRDLDIGDTRVFLGIVLPVDGVDGLRRRHSTAAEFLDDFGVAMYCGFGRQPGEDPADTMRIHAETVRAVR